jgi:hypothetical protein
VQTQTDPRYTLSASGLPLALRQTVGPTRFSQIRGPDAPIPFEKCGLASRPNPAPLSDGGQRRLRARWDGGSRCKSLSVACGHSRSRRNSSMRARMVAKSSAARGRVTFPLHWLVSSLVAGGSLAAHRRERF